MFRSSFVSLIVASAAFSQGRDDQYVPEKPRQFGDRGSYGPVLGLTTDNSLRTRERQLDKPVSTGLVLPELPDEALVDVEAWLREPIPAEELSLRRIGFRRPPRLSIWREDYQLPDEDVLIQDRRRLRTTIDNMQGIWRVQKMILDGRVLEPEEFAGLKYLIQDTVLFQSETSESWSRPSPASIGPKRTETATGLPIGEPGARGTLAEQPANEIDRLGPTAYSKPAAGGQREDPRQEEGVRLHMLYRGEGLAAVYWWNRDADVVDPHESRNRPSLRVSWPVRGGIELGDGTLTLGVRGLGLRSVLPSKFDYRFNRLHTPPEEYRTRLEGERTLFLVMVRDEALDNRISDVRPVEEAATLAAGEPGTRGRQNIIPQMHRVNTVEQMHRVNTAVPQMHRVPLTPKKQ